MEILDRRKEVLAKESRRIISFAVAGLIFINIYDMNPMHAIEEIKATGGHINSIDKNVVNGCIDIQPNDMANKIAELLANGWEWE